MRKVHSDERYDYYIGHNKDPQGFTFKLYNIVPKDSDNPGGGYPNMKYIEEVKGVKFPDRFQPALHGIKTFA